MSGEAHFEIYPHTREDGEHQKHPTGEYGWRLRAANGAIVAVAGEGFTRREDANRAIHDMLDAATGQQPHPPILDVDD